MIVANFLAGLLIGTLLGLAVAPVLRAWLTWKSIEEARQDDGSESDREPSRLNQ